MLTKRKAFNILNSQKNLADMIMAMIKLKIVLY